MPKSKVFKFRKILDKRVEDHQLQYRLLWANGDIGWEMAYNVYDFTEIANFEKSYQQIKTMERAQRRHMRDFIRESQTWEGLGQTKEEAKIAAEEAYRLEYYTADTGYPYAQFADALVSIVF
jgi:hypothetical protein